MSGLLFPPEDIPEDPKSNRRKRKGIAHPLWSQNKALLIQQYIRLFTFITKHGIYIDGFAAPQRRDQFGLCSANLVLSNEPQWIRAYFLCDIDPVGVAKLEEIADAHADQRKKVTIINGDFNKSVDVILASGKITDKTATFALLDQRTFECQWATVEKLAKHKSTMKIEIFYFFAHGWIDRSLAAATQGAKLDEISRWWGREDWQILRTVTGLERAMMIARRFTDELGYAEAVPFAIHNRGRGGRVMYYMIHATDHPDAIQLMLRAYRKVSGRTDVDRELTQTDLIEHLAEMARQDQP